jgi:hypothetical protein
VSRKVATPGGTTAAISAIVSSGITPGPLGIAETRPRAEAPWRTAVQASSRERMQQILTRGRAVASTGPTIARMIDGLARALEGHHPADAEETADLGRW